MAGGGGWWQFNCEYIAKLCLAELGNKTLKNRQDNKRINKIELLWRMQPLLSGDNMSGLTHVRAVFFGGTVVRGNICPGNICPGGPTKRLGAADKWMMVTMLG